MQKSIMLPSIKRSVLARMALPVVTFLSASVTVAFANPGALPQGGSVVSGRASISALSGSNLTINQQSQRAIVNWNSFSIGRDNSVTINQPNSSAAMLNRVTGDTSSTIAGQLDANGQVYLVNPNGIAITPTGTVKVGGGFVASTLDISNDNFNAGKLTFQGNGASASVSNAGSIVSSTGGFAALLGGTAANSGLISVPLGKIGVGSGERQTLDLYGNGFLQVALPSSGKGSKPLIDLGGQTMAEGGTVVVKAATVAKALQDAVKVTGAVSVSSVYQDGGVVVFDGGSGGQVNVSGTVKATSDRARGGALSIGGQAIALKSSLLDVSGATGGGKVTIGGGKAGAPVAGLSMADKLLVDKGSMIKADAQRLGNGGDVTLWSNKGTGFEGTISAQALGSSGNGGNAEVSGGRLAYTGTTNLLAARGKTGMLTLDPGSIIICHTGDSGCSGAMSLAAIQGDTSTTSVDYMLDSVLESALSTASVTLTASNAINDIALYVVPTASRVNIRTLTGGSLTLNAPNISLLGTYGIAGGLVLNNSDASSTLGGVLANLGSLTYNGTGTLTVTGIKNTFTGPVVVNSGTVITAGQVIGASPLGKGTLTINNNGIVMIATNNGIFTNSSVTVNDNATLTTANGVGGVVNNLTLNGGTLASGTPNEEYGTWNFNSSQTVQVTANSTISAMGMDTFNSGNVNINVSPGVTLAMTGTFYNNPSHLPFGVQYFGGGKVLVTGNSTYTQGTVIGAGTSVNVGNGGTSGALGSGDVGNNGTLTIDRSDAGTLNLSSVAGPIKGTGNVAIKDSGGDFVVDNGISLTGVDSSLSIDGVSAINVIQPISVAGANSKIRLSAGNSKPAGTATGGDVTLNASISTSATGTVSIYSGNATTSALVSRINGATGPKKYATYGVSYGGAAAPVAGTLNFYYRSAPVITISGVTVSNKVYDATTSATVNFANAKVTTTSGDALVLTNVGGAFSDQNAGNGKTVNLSGISVQGTDSSWVLNNLTNLVLSSTSQTSASANITPATLMLRPKSSTIMYSGVALSNPGYSQNLGNYTITGFLGGDTLASTGLGLTGSMAFAGGTTVPVLNVGSYVFGQGSLAQSGAGNYVISFANPTGNSYTITPAPLTITGGSYTSIYNAREQSNTFKVDGLLGTDTVTGVSGLGSGLHVGKYVDALGGATGTGLSNYAITYTNGALNITPAVLTVNGKTNNVTFNANTQTNSGAATSGVLDGDTFAISGYATGTNAGSYTDNLKVTGLGATQASDYLITYNQGVLNIGRANLTIAGTKNNHVTYNTVGQTNTYTVTGLQGTDSITAATGSGSGTNVGTYSDNLAGATFIKGDLSNYNVTYINGSLIIDPAALTITGGKTSVVYNGNNRTNSFSVAGLLGMDTVTGVAGVATGTNAGSYVDTLNSATGTGLGNYTITYVNGSLNIAKANLTVTGSNNIVTYNGGVQTNTGTVIDGAQGTDKFTISGLGSGTNAGLYNDNLLVTGVGTTLTSNYTITYNNGGLTINRAALTVTAAANTKVYDANTSAAKAATITGLQGADTASATEVYTSPNAGTGLLLVASTPVFSKGLASNYDITYVNSTAGVITPAALTITGNTLTNVYSGRTQTNTYTVAGLLGSDTVTGVSGLGSGLHVGKYVDALSGATGTGLSNYNITYTNGSMNVTPAALVVNGATNNVTFNANAQTNSGASVSGALGSDTFAFSGYGTGTNAGSYTDNLQVMGQGATQLSDYTITINQGVLNISKANLTIAGTKNNHVTYNATAQTNTYTVTGLQGTDSITAATGSGSGTNAGTYSDNLAGATFTKGDLSNYNVTYINGSLIIDPAALTITGGKTSVVYNGSNRSNSFATAGLLGTDTVTGVAGVATGTNAGSYVDTLNSATGSGLSNYIITYINGSLDIARAALTVTGSNNIVTYNGGVQTNTGTVIDGAQGTDSFTVSGMGSGTNAGVYNDNLLVTGVGTTLTSNYTITYNNGGLTINRAALTVTAAANTKVYDANTSAAKAATITGLQGADTASATEVYTSPNAGTGLLLVASTPVFSKGLASNYDITYVNSTAGVITPAPLIITGNTLTNVYSGGTQVNTVTVAGLLGSDTVTGVSGLGSGLHVGKYVDALSGATGTGLSNYNITYTNGSMNITPATLVVNGATNNVAFNANTQTNSGASVSGALGSDTFAFSGYGAGVNAGSYKDNLNVTGLGATQVTDYTITYNQGVLNIGKANLTIAGTKNNTVTYNATAQTNTYQVTGLQGTDAITGVTGSATATNAGTYSDNLTGATFTKGDLANYNVTYVNGTLVINPATLTVNGATTNLTYNGSARTNGGAKVVGALGNDSFSVSGYAKGTNVGAYADDLVVAGDGATLVGNYNVIYNNGTLNIGKARLAVAGATNVTTYNGSVQTNGGATINGAQGTDSFKVSGYGSGTNAGSYKDNLVLDGVGSTLLTNYDIVYTQGMLNIGKAALTVSGANNTLTYKGVLQTNSGAVVVGAQGNDSFTVSGYANGVNAGQYSDNLSVTGGGTTLASNYDITYNNATLTINRAALMVTAAANTKVYDSTTSATTLASITGLQGSDVASANEVYTTSNAGTGLTLVASTPTFSSGLASNYDITYVNSTAGVITPAALTITGNGTHVIYNAGVQSNGYTVKGLRGADTVTGVDGLASGTNVGTYADALANASGTGLSNYDITYVNGALDIGKAALTITGSTGSRVYDGVVHTNVYQTVGLQGNDVVTGVSGQASGKHAGTYADALANASGTGLSNYDITYVNGTMLITPATLTVTGSNGHTTYNGIVQTNGSASVSGAQGTDSFTVSGYANGTNAGAYVDNLAVTGVGSTLLSDYSIVYNQGVLNVDRANLTVTGADHTVAYNGSVQTNSGAVVKGAVGEDAFSIGGYASGISAGAYTDALTLAALGGASLDNYNVDYRQGTLTIRGNTPGESGGGGGLRPIGPSLGSGFDSYPSQNGASTFAPWVNVEGSATVPTEAITLQAVERGAMPDIMITSPVRMLLSRSLSSNMLLEISPDGVPEISGETCENAAWLGRSRLGHVSSSAPVLCSGVR